MFSPSLSVTFCSSSLYYFFFYSPRNIHLMSVTLSLAQCSCTLATTYIPILELLKRKLLRIKISKSSDTATWSLLSSMPASISFRQSIRWLPDGASEPTDTIVLTGFKTGVFLDVRFIKSTNDLDWAFAGYRSSGGCPRYRCRAITTDK